MRSTWTVASLFERDVVGAVSGSTTISPRILNPAIVLKAINGEAMRHTLLQINLALRALMEFGIVLGIAWWGYHVGTTAVSKILTAIGAPAVAFSLWGFIDFHQVGRIAEPLRLIQELLISGLAAVALLNTGQPIFGWTLVALSIIHHVMVYALGDKLLKR